LINDWKDNTLKSDIDSVWESKTKLKKLLSTKT